MNHRYRNILTIAMLILLIVGLAGMVVPRRLHETGGYVLILLAVCHAWVNRGFFKNLRRGSYPMSRIAGLASIGFFAAALLLLLISGFGMSVSSGFSAAWNLRSLHMTAAIASLILLLTHLYFHARRYLRTRKASLLLIPALLLAGLSVVGLPYLDRWFHHVSVHRADIIPGEKAPLAGRTLTVYFSRVGNTDFPANVDAVSGASLMADDGELLGNAQVLSLMAQDAAGGDHMPIRTVKTYPSSYGETTAVAKEEFASGELPTLQEMPFDPAAYDNIILVYPLWWNQTPAAVARFVSSYDLHGKRILPIVTHGGGGLGDAIQTLRAHTDADVADGLSVYSSDVPSARSDVAAYLKKHR